jgi:transposase
VSGSLERFLLDRAETVVRLPPRLMADMRRGVRERGKSDPIDALAIARAALREGIDTLPTARLAGPDLELRLLGLHRERLVDSRTRLINELRWQLHDLWPEWEIPGKALVHPRWQTKVTRRLQSAEPSVRVRIARDRIRRIRELTRTIVALRDELAGLVTQAAPQLLAETGIGVLLAAKFIGEIAGIDRFRSDAQLARLGVLRFLPPPDGATATASILVEIASSTTPSICWHSPRSATTLRPRSTSPSSARTAKRKPEAIRSLKRHLRRLDIGALSLRKECGFEFCFQPE